MAASGADAAGIVERKGLRQVSDASAPESIARTVIAENAKIVADYKGGKEAALKALIGRIMKATQGRANPKTAEEVLKLPFVAPRYFRADPAEPSVDGFPDQRLPRDIRFEAEFLETHRRFVLDGLAAAVLPDFVVAEEEKSGRVVRLPGPKLGREIWFLKRRGRPLPAGVDAFLKEVGRTLRSL
jgi:hypothetical protein